jgi:hypothetical protein
MKLWCVMSFRRQRETQQKTVISMILRDIAFFLIGFFRELRTLGHVQGLIVVYIIYLVTF